MLEAGKEIRALMEAASYKDGSEPKYSKELMAEYLQRLPDGEFAGICNFLELVGGHDGQSRVIVSVERRKVGEQLRTTVLMNERSIAFDIVGGLMTALEKLRADLYAARQMGYPVEEMRVNQLRDAVIQAAMMKVVSNQKFSA